MISTRFDPFTSIVQDDPGTGLIPVWSQFKINSGGMSSISTTALISKINCSLPPQSLLLSSLQSNYPSSWRNSSYKKETLPSHLNVQLFTKQQRSPTLLDRQGLETEIACLISFPLAANFGQVLSFQSLNRSNLHLDSKRLWKMMNSRLVAMQWGILTNRCLLLGCTLLSHFVSHFSQPCWHLLLL